MKRRSFINITDTPRKNERNYGRTKPCCGKNAEIENSSLNEIEKAEKMEEMAKAVAETTGSADVVAEAEKFKDKNGSKGI